MSSFFNLNLSRVKPNGEFILSEDALIFYDKRLGIQVNRNNRKG